MARQAAGKGRGLGTLWRILIWGTALSILLLPAVAMQFTDEVKWDAPAFLVLGALLFAACGTIELAARASASLAYRFAVGIALVAAFLLIWMNLAAGIIGDEDNPANLMFGAVLLTALAGAFIARFRPGGMARALAAAAAAQILVAAIALALGAGAGEPVWPWGFVMLSGVFAGLWLLWAWLFSRAAWAQAATGATA